MKDYSAGYLSFIIKMAFLAHENIIILDLLAQIPQSLLSIGVTFSFLKFALDVDE